MKRLAMIGILFAGITASAYAAEEETDLVTGAGAADTFRYGYSTEDYTTADGETSQETWLTARSGHLAGSIDGNFENYRLRLNSNGGELLGVQNTAVGQNLLNKFQVELGAASHKSPYSVLALEAPLAPGAAIYFGTVNNPGGAQRFLVGPIVYWGNSHSMLLYYPKGRKSDSVVEHSLVLRNRVREFGKWAWLDVDASYKVVPTEDQVDSFEDYGYGATLGLWKMYGKYSVTPYHEGLLVQRATYEVGIDASF